MSTPLNILQLHWHHDQFRPMQEEIIQSVLDGRDTLALLPTGGGKSICFQVPAILKEGLCLVISPLIALMRDQVRALAQDPDPALRERLVRLARWERSAEVRGTALVALARLKDLKDERTLNEALAHTDPAVRFGAMEALLSWGRPEKAVPLLRLAAEHDRQPLLRVYAAGGMARLGDAGGLEKLREFLNSPEWTARAMAARYLGDYGADQDYEMLLSRLDREGSNEFVSAEYAIAALKIFVRKAP